MELNINVRVSLDLSDRLERMLTRLLAQGVTAEQPKETRQLAEPAAEPVTEPPTVAEPEPVTEPQTEAEPEPEPEPAAPVYDAAYVRDVMEATRRRIEGEGYTSDHPLHKPLTSEFKRLAEIVSGGTESQTSKPTLLPPELIPQFEAKCKELYVDSNGQLATELPF